jgi:hypothetical protein
MLIPNRTVLLPALSHLYNYLKTNKVPQYRGVCCDAYCDKIAVHHSTISDNRYSIRMWKTKAVFSYWYNEHNSPNSMFISALDYTIYPDHVKIEYMNINDEEYRELFPGETPGLTEKEAAKMNKCLIDYSKMVAKEFGRKRVIVDVHGNMRIFNNYYAPEGFTATSRRCKDNPFWVEAECVL